MPKVPPHLAVKRNNQHQMFGYRPVFLTFPSTSCFFIRLRRRFVFQGCPLFHTLSVNIFKALDIFLGGHRRGSPVPDSVSHLPDKLRANVAAAEYPRD
jgi:hypothetical protein